LRYRNRKWQKKPLQGLRYRNRVFAPCCLAVFTNIYLSQGHLAAMFIFGLVALLGWGAWRMLHNKVPGNWTPERQAMYRVAMAFETDPDRLRDYAKKFADDGFPRHAANLYARSRIPQMAGEERAKYAAVARKALSSQKPDAVREVAAGYEQAGMGAAAEAMRDYARGLDVIAKAKSYRGAPYQRQYHLIAVPQPAVAAPPTAPNDAPTADPNAPAHAALRQDHVGLHQDHTKLSTEHHHIMTAIHDLQTKLGGAPWLRGVAVGGEDEATMCILVHVTDATPDVVDAVPTHSMGVPVYVRDARG
jgi:hypothetical protein